METEKAYIYQPTGTKRRRLTTNPLNASTRPARSAIHTRLWTSQHARLSTVLSRANDAFVERVNAFLKDGPAVLTAGVRSLKAGYVLAGPEGAGHAELFARLGGDVEGMVRVVCLVPAEGASLRGLVRAFVRKVMGGEGVDLASVLEWVWEEKVGVLAVGVVDSEAFGSGVLVEFLDLLCSWSDRIPLVVLFGVATSIEIFQDRLPRTTLRALSSTQFDVVQSKVLLEQLFESTVAESEFWVGPTLAGVLLERQQKHIQSPDDFVNAVQYAYMCHFFSNPLSIFLGTEEEIKKVKSNSLFEALRCTESFQQKISELADDPLTLNEAKQLLKSDDDLVDHVVDEIARSRASLVQLTTSIKLLRAARKQFTNIADISFSTLYLQGFGGDLKDSALLREFFLNLKKAPSNMLSRIMSIITPFVPAADLDQLAEIQMQLAELIQRVGAKDPLKSQYDVKNDTLRTTVVAQKVELSRNKARISEDDAAYSKILDTFHDWLTDLFNDTLVCMEDIPYREILIYDGRGPDKAVFTPRHRYVIERALSSPHDYLNCECCKSTARDEKGDVGLSKTQPSTALLYQLYLESGASINVADLWTAFNAIMSEDEEEEAEKRNMYLFQTALAELKYLGLVRSTKKKADHILKVSWKGL
ncbi:hypothetical protein BT63DRAFT_408831 [Microthyrium microscopicum]|uniref:Uncharacterized protein n=1 Tax=Microthyrium microscopicum TaxID=703497 RepID=A0A6A6USD1_9PEZI|nr:hypothetical protein BT63DRAFT_408831 [Microthyrium microscopicum]